VTREGNTFKVVPTSDCTIRVIFEAKQQVTVCYKSNDVIVSTETAYSGDTVTLPDYTGTAPEGYAFVGWTENLVNDVDRMPSYAESGDAYLVTGDTDLYALFSYVVEGEGGSGTWTLVTSSSMLTPGAQVVLTENSSGVVAASLSNTYLSVIENVSFSSDKSTITTLPTNAMIFTLDGRTDAWTLSNFSNMKLGATAKKKLSFSGGTTTWSIVISNNCAIIRNGTFDYGEILYNPGSPRFTTYNPNEYTSGLQPQLYMLSNGATTYYTTTNDAVKPYVITAEANDSKMGTVSVSENIITAVPAEGYQVVGYSVTGGTATVIRRENTFEVVATSDCTIQILFKKIHVEGPARCPLCVMAEKNPLFARHIHMKPVKP
jgi:hypothetical protein